MNGTTRIVAVVITCFNEGPFIGAAVQSVLAQTVAQQIGEIIIADDGSDNDTLRVLRDIESWDDRVKVLYGPGGARQAAQRNLAVKSTEMPFVAFLDGDDLWQPEKLSAQLEACQDDPAIGLVYTGFSNFSDTNAENVRPAKLIDITDARDLAMEYFLNDPPILPSTVLMRRNVYVDSGGMDPTIHCFEETEFYLRIAPHTRFACLASSLVLKRNRASSITGGRADLLAFHAFVALKAAAANPGLMGSVPARLAERARKLANQHFLNGDRVQARLVSTFAVRMAPYKPSVWISWILARVPASGARLLHRTLFTSRVSVNALRDTS